MKIFPNSLNNKNSYASKRSNQPVFKGDAYFNNLLNFTQKAFPSKVYSQSFKPMADFINDKGKILKELFKLSKNIELGLEKFQQQFQKSTIYNEISDIPLRSGKSDTFWLKKQNEDALHNLSIVGHPLKLEGPDAFFAYSKQSISPQYGPFKAFEISGDIRPEHKIPKSYSFQLFEPQSGYIDTIFANYLEKNSDFTSFSFSATPQIFKDSPFYAKMYDIKSPKFLEAIETAKTYKAGQTGAFGDFYIKKLIPLGDSGIYRNSAQITKSIRFNNTQDINLSAVFNFDNPEDVNIIIGRFGV